jgi:hypothetical protein
MKLKEHLLNKKIIFFSVQTFDLEKEIVQKLIEYGAIVDYYDERPSNNIFAKGIIRLKRSVYQYKIDKYYNKILKNIEGKEYDILFVNRGEVIPGFFLEEFKKAQPQCEMLFYTWDSFTNHKHPITILKYFNKKFTFDSDDAIKYGINFRPLFYLDQYKDVKSEKRNIKYDLLFLGTAHSDRYEVSQKVIKWSENNGFKSFCYYFIHSRLLYFYKKKFDKTFNKFDYKKLSFKSLTKLEILELYKETNVILDINHPGQKGLTMRTFEALGAGKKLITTNEEIKKYPFYNPKNIYVINRDNIVLDKSFFDTPYENVSEEIYYKASIEGWLNCVFVEKDLNFWIKEIA